MLQKVIIGMVFNDWTVVDDTPIIENKKYRNRSFRVKCKCDKEHVILISSLRTGTSKMCRSCSSKECMSDKFKATWIPQTCGDLGGTLYCSIKNRAKYREIPFNLSKEFMWNLLEKQQFKCALSGLDIHLSTKLNKSGTNPDYSLITASLDRINSDKDYTEDNVQWVHKDVNKMKNAFDQSYFLHICSLINNNEIRK